MNLSLSRNLLRAAPLVLCLTAFVSCPSQAQVAGADQGIFSDEEQMLRINNAQINNYEQQLTAAQNELQAEDQKNQTYRLYAEKRVQELSKGTAAGAKKGTKEDPNQLAILQDWLRRDAAYKAKQQAYINQLQSSIQNLQRGQQDTLTNLSSDINSMRETVQDKRDAQKFDQMMQVNYFNELQSEMGAATWGRPPDDGTYNSVGSYGPLGGYGMGYGGRRNYW